MKVNLFLNRLYLALNSKTKYKKGGWGSHKGDLWYFDCVCLIKSILWGWDKDINKSHGGAVYKSNGVPDIGDNKIIKVCKNVSNDFKNIKRGELVWMEGHVGIYVGDYKVIEATKAWENKVVLSDISNTGVRSYHGKKVKKWISHGFLPYVEYNTYDGELPKLPKRGYFKLNDKGIEVKKLQKFLNWALDIKLDVDGIYGNNTKKAVKDFQKINNIKVDGLFGMDSLKKAKEYIK